MKLIKSSIAITGLVVLSGCASHAQIDMPVVSQVHTPVLEGKTLAYDIYYSQPTPGLFNAGKQQALAPLEEAELSIASAATLKNLPDYIYEQLPSSVSRGEPGNSDYRVHVELTAHDKKGPVFADFQLAETVGKGFLTLGLAPSEYQIIADFEARYELHAKDILIYAEDYTVKDDVDHERGDFETYNSVNDPAGQLLKKHLILTLNDFFSDAAEEL
ncbi:hypothetical protein [Onishia taeanensis]